jgi:hypothetical protein
MSSRRFAYPADSSNRRTLDPSVSGGTLAPSSRSGTLTRG